jgi:hypothetical protein
MEIRIAIMQDETEFYNLNQTGRDGPPNRRNWNVIHARVSHYSKGM